MKKTKTIIILLICITIIAIFIPKVSMAKSFDPEKYKPDIYTEKGLSASDYYKPFLFASNILSAITFVGVIISVIMVMVLGIKYMLGSVEEKAEYKKTMIPMLIGAILLFCSSTLVSIIYNLVIQMR